MFRWKNRRFFALESHQRLSFRTRFMNTNTKVLILSENNYCIDLSVDRKKRSDWKSNF